ncbi:MAG: hypothetical protein AB1646_15995 [Thermodesulfobacteriota bacterium]
MKHWTVLLFVGLCALSAFCCGVPRVLADDLGGKSCEELLRLAKECEADLKTVEIVLGAAIDAGNMDKIKSYKMRRGTSIKMRNQIMSAIRFKGCLPTR